MLGISKVMTMTCTYDHRIIQGAESGMFLGTRAGAAGRRATGSTKRSSTTCACRTSRCAGRRTASLPARHERRALRRDRQGSRDHPADQRLPRARAPDRRPRSAGRRAQLPPELDPETYGLTIWDLDREFLTGSLGEAIGEGAPKAGRHAARDPGDAAPDLLRQNRLRVHEHPGPGAEALAAAAHGAGGQQLAAGPRNAPAHPAQRDGRRRVRALPALALRRAEALRARRRRDRASRSWTNCWSAPPAATSTRWSSAWPTAAASTCWPTSSARPSSRSSPSSKARSTRAARRARAT